MDDLQGTRQDGDTRQGSSRPLAPEERAATPGDRALLAITNVCVACEKPIAFVKTPRGKKMPLDIEPAENGNVLVREEDGGLVAIVLGSGLPAEQEKGTPLYVSHFATCPQADRFRR